MSLPQLLGSFYPSFLFSSIPRAVYPTYFSSQSERESCRQTELFSLPAHKTLPKGVRECISLKEGRVCCVASKDNTWLVTLDLLVLISRYRGKTYRATVKIVRTSDQVADFCRRVCAKLECCPNLFSPVLVAEVCPENCSIHTKTKYSEYWLGGLLLARIQGSGMLCVS